MSSIGRSIFEQRTPPGYRSPASKFKETEAGVEGRSCWTSGEFETRREKGRYGCATLSMTLESAAKAAGRTSMGR